MVGLVSAALLHDLRSRFPGAYRTTLFLPQVIPLVATGIVWGWIYSSTGILNQGLEWIGLDFLTRPWLGDFDIALPAVGVVGAWVLTGFCTLLLTSGIAKIDPRLYDAAKVDGAGRIREFFAVTLPGVFREIGVCVIVTMIGALASFDIVFITTRGGPGRETLVPGVQIYRLAFLERRIGVASAMAVILMVLIWILVLPTQKYFQAGQDEIGDASFTGLAATGDGDAAPVHPGAVCDVAICSTPAGRGQAKGVHMALEPAMEQLSRGLPSG